MAANMFCSLALGRYGSLTTAGSPLDESAAQNLLFSVSLNEINPASPDMYSSRIIPRVLLYKFMPGFYHQSYDPSCCSTTR